MLKIKSFFSKIKSKLLRKSKFDNFFLFRGKIIKLRGCGDLNIYEKESKYPLDYEEERGIKHILEQHFEALQPAKRFYDWTSIEFNYYLRKMFKQYSKTYHTRLIYFNIESSDLFDWEQFKLDVKGKINWFRNAEAYDLHCYNQELPLFDRNLIMLCKLATDFVKFTFMTISNHFFTLNQIAFKKLTQGKQEPLATPP